MSESESGSGSGSEGNSSEGMEATFEGFAPKEGDFHGIKNLLTQLLVGTEIDASNLADAILAEPDVSSVLKVDDGDDEVFGVISPLGLKKHGKAASVAVMKALIGEKCSKHGSAKVKERITAAISGSSGKNVAILINERMINLPQELAMALTGALSEDLKEAVEADKTYKFDEVIVFCKSVESMTRGGEPAQKKKKNADGASAAAAASSGSEVLFVNLEDDVFKQNCSCSFTYPQPESQWISRKGGLKERSCRTVMLLTASQLKKSWTDLESMLT